MSREAQLLESISIIEKRELRLREMLMATRIAWAKDIVKPMQQANAKYEEMGVELIKKMPGLKVAIAGHILKKALKII